MGFLSNAIVDSTIALLKNPIVNWSVISKKKIKPENKSELISEMKKYFWLGFFFTQSILYQGIGKIPTSLFPNDPGIETELDIISLLEFDWGLYHLPNERDVSDTSQRQFEIPTQKSQSEGM